MRPGLEGFVKGGNEPCRRISSSRSPESNALDWPVRTHSTTPRTSSSGLIANRMMADSKIGPPSPALPPPASWPGDPRSAPCARDQESGSSKHSRRKS